MHNITGITQWKRYALSGAIVALLLATGTARAATFYNGWNYAIDSQNDGSGGANYEGRGLAYKISGNSVTFAISSGMPLGTNFVNGALNGKISQGDLFLNFSAHNLDTAAKFNDPNVLGIRFDASNDSLNNIGGSNTTLGVFKNLSVTSLTTQNHGYATLQQYIDYGFGRTTHAMGDLQNSTGDVTAYFGNGVMYPNIQAGNQIGLISLKDKGQLTGLGLDFAHFGADPAGNNVYGFSFDRTLLPNGNFTGSLFEECINDGLAIKGSDVPEPGVVALLGAGLLTLGGLIRRRRARR